MVDEKIFELIYEASKSREKLKLLEEALKKLSPGEARTCRLLAKSISYIRNRTGNDVKETMEVLERVIDERIADGFDEALLEFYRWLVKIDNGLK